MHLKLCSLWNLIYTSNALHKMECQIELSIINAQVPLCSKVDWCLSHCFSWCCYISYFPRKSPESNSTFQMCFFKVNNNLGAFSSTIAKICFLLTQPFFRKLSSALFFQAQLFPFWIGSQFLLNSILKIKSLLFFSPFLSRAYSMLLVQRG